MTLYLVWTPQHEWEPHKAEAFGDSPEQGLDAQEMAMKAVRRLYPLAELDQFGWSTWARAAQHCPGWEDRAVEIRIVYGGRHDCMRAWLVRLAQEGPQ